MNRFQIYEQRIELEGKVSRKAKEFVPYFMRNIDSLIEQYKNEFRRLTRIETTDPDERKYWESIMRKKQEIRDKITSRFEEFDEEFYKKTIEYLIEIGCLYFSECVQYILDMLPQAPNEPIGNAPGQKELFPAEN